jgi:hypothetical protein
MSNNNLELTNNICDQIKTYEFKLHKTLSVAQVNKSIQINNYFILNKFCMSAYDFDEIDVYPKINLEIEKTILQLNEFSSSSSLLKNNNKQKTKRNLINLTPSKQLKNQNDIILNKQSSLIKHETFTSNTRNSGDFFLFHDMSLNKLKN